MNYKGSLGLVKLNLSIATQSDYGDSPLNYDAPYYLVQVDVPVSGVTFTAGYEVLGSDGGAAGFRTPLATLHKFQGWADKFLNTPADGIEDIFVGVKGKLGPVKLAAIWHDFDADEGGRDYGSELDLLATYPVTKALDLRLKYADYSEKGFATDTTKIWITAIFKL